MRRVTITAGLLLAIPVVATACSTPGVTEGTGATTTTSPGTTTAGVIDPPTTAPHHTVPSDYAGYLDQPVACAAEPPPPAVVMEFDEPLDVDISGRLTATINTSCGSIVIALDPQAAPEAVNSFVFLAEQGYFDGTVSHRIVPGFVVQAGDPTATGRGGPGYTIADEYPATANYRRGVVAMANAGRGTTGSQFFIMLGDAPWLAPKYTIFGEVVSGFETLDAIERIPLGIGPASADPRPSTPLESLFIESVTVNR
jgi:peptidyl-prolyl cis-trans isomerase B (cyclophilin B)